jgi:hypothetical protein
MNDSPLNSMDTRDTKCRWHRCDIFLLGLTSKSGHPILYCPGTNHKALDTQRRRRLKKQSAKEMRQYRTKRASKTSNRYQIPMTKGELSGIVGYARVGASRIPVRGWIRPSAENSRPRIEDQLKQPEVQRVLKENAARLPSCGAHK